MTGEVKRGRRKKSEVVVVSKTINEITELSEEARKLKEHIKFLMSEENAKEVKLEYRKVLKSLNRLMRQIDYKFIKTLIKEANLPPEYNQKYIYTLEETGAVLGVTRERVRQIESGALKKIKHPKIIRSLNYYVKHL